ncbi:MAG: hypothetical protein K2G67_01325 [Muribaculaceae bacterium]|nr:hypothetical protein [Muribaculaceae bacterium]
MLFEYSHQANSNFSITMKNKITKAIQANDIPQARELLIEMMSSRAGNTKTILEISETIASTPGIFDTDDGKTYPVAHEITEEHLAILSEDLRRNFSLPKFRLFTEVHARIVRDPDFNLKSSSSNPESNSEDNKKRRHCRPLLIVGYILMALGIVASIVGICVPVRFLIGLGIGVLMLGLAVTYSAIPR